MKKINLNSNLLVSGGLIVLGLAQAVLSNKQKTNELTKLKGELKGEIIADLAGQKQN